uniref:Protein kinase domain-containing protein n=1 Tax=Caenorhabditis tropicalis TaxID=1561998 RepID=A0A1I7TCK4_9PELO
MRDGDVDIPFSDRQEIKKEAQFYLLDDLMKLCDDAKPVEKQINHRFFKIEYDMNCVAINQNIHVFNKETKRSGMCTISRLRETIATLFPNRT